MKMTIESPSGEIIELSEDDTTRIVKLADAEGVTPEQWLRTTLLTEHAIVNATSPHVDRMIDKLLKARK